jgi:hypothetical protein
MKIHWTRSLALRAIKAFGPSFQGSALYYRWPAGTRPGRRLGASIYVITITGTGAMDVPLDFLTDAEAGTPLTSVVS